MGGLFRDAFAESAGCQSGGLFTEAKRSLSLLGHLGLLGGGRADFSGKRSLRLLGLLGGGRADFAGKRSHGAAGSKASGNSTVGMISIRKPLFASNGLQASKARGGGGVLYFRPSCCKALDAGPQDSRALVKVLQPKREILKLSPNEYQNRPCEDGICFKQKAPDICKRPKGTQLEIKQFRWSV